MAVYYAYRAPPCNTTFVDQTFPEHHLPFEQIRHTVGHAINEFFDPLGSVEHVFAPSADVRETEKKFYIDIELPGLHSKESLGLKWTNDTTLLVDAKIKRPEIEGDQESTKADQTSTEEKKDPVHLLAHGRRIGRFVRSFYFSAEVNHESMDAKMSCGLLRITVEKMRHEQKKAKTIEIKHLD